ncbi:MAG: hypothetical protein JNG89_00245 [Planctomycetaceae bacterium]|nr:hypothetical protein [Planctomycetaceae bacterium]
MNNIEAPPFPDYIDDEHFHLSKIRLPAFAGMQVTDGPYGAVSAPGPSTGETHAVAEKQLEPEEFRTVVQWVIEHDDQIRSNLLRVLLEQYRELRDFVIEDLDDENPESVVPEISEPDELVSFCGLVALHVGGLSSGGEPFFGIELGCDWEEEHGAGVRFVGSKVVKAGHASDAFSFQDEDL